MAENQKFLTTKKATEPIGIDEKSQMRVTFGSSLNKDSKLNTFEKVNTNSNSNQRLKVTLK
jgi:hypothetical protein